MKNIIIPDYDKSWKEFFNLNKENLEKIDREINEDNFNPSPENVLRFSKMPLQNIKVVILGQDTYPQKGVATGRSFEVGGLEDWSTSFKQISLKHIIQNIYACYTEKSPYTKFSEIKKEILEDRFDILQPNKLFDSWEQQGVLCLNAALTCKVGESGSHSEYWKNFIENLIQYIVKENPDVKWFLWGNEAKTYIHLVENCKVYASRHPMMCSPKYEDDFLKNQCFKETMNEIVWTGI